MAALRATMPADLTLTTGEAVPSGADTLVAGRPRPEDVRQPALARLIVPYAGLPATTRDLLLAERPDLVVYNLHHNARATAELAVALLFAAARGVVPADAALRRHDWQPRYSGDRGLLLHGRRALVLGYGAVGRTVATMLAALGMRVRATRKRGEMVSREGSVEIHPAEALRNLLPEAEIVVIALPQTPETAGLLGAEALALLPRSCVLVNVARAAVVNEEALFEALRERRIYAAGLDVWYQYPKAGSESTPTPPSRYPFETLDNVVLSPHRGGLVRDTERLRMLALGELLARLSAGDDSGSIDLHAGY